MTDDLDPVPRLDLPPLPDLGNELDPDPITEAIDAARDRDEWSEPGDLPPQTFELVVGLIRQELAGNLAATAGELAAEIAGYTKTGLTRYSIESARIVLRELVELVLLLEPDLPPLPELATGGMVGELGPVDYWERRRIRDLDAKGSE